MSHYLRLEYASYLFKITSNYQLTSKNAISITFPPSFENLSRINCENNFQGMINPPSCTVFGQIVQVTQAFNSN